MNKQIEHKGINGNFMQIFFCKTGILQKPSSDKNGKETIMNLYWTELLRTHRSWILLQTYSSVMQELCIFLLIEIVFRR